MVRRTRCSLYLPTPRPTSSAARHAGAIKRLTATVAALALFVFAVLLALTFANPAQSPPSPGGTVRLFLALGALFPAGLAVYLSGRGQYRGARQAALVVAVLYGVFFLVAFAGSSSSG